MIPIKDEDIRRYVLNENVWKVDLPSFIMETRNANGRMYNIVYSILFRILHMLIVRCIEINDPVLNIIMIDLALYEGSHTEEAKIWKEQLRKEILENE